MGSVFAPCLFEMAVGGFSLNDFDTRGALEATGRRCIHSSAVSWEKNQLPVFALELPPAPCADTSWGASPKGHPRVVPC